MTDYEWHAAERAEGRIGGRRKKLDSSKRREIAKSVISGRKTGTEMGASTTSARLPCHASSPHTALDLLSAGLSKLLPAEK